MPTYRYRCSQCGEELDAWQSIHDPSLTTHDPGCGGELRKVLGMGGIVLKGPGFYRNDSRAGNGRSGHRERERERERSGSGNESSGSGDSSGSSGSESGSSGSDSKSGSSDSSATKKASPSGSKAT